MKRPLDFAIYSLRFVAVALLVVYAMTVAPAQQNLPYGGGGVVEDWTSHHVVFSNPGTLMDAIMNGRRQEWERIVSDPRYRMQLIRQSGAWSEQQATPVVDSADLREDDSLAPDLDDHHRGHHEGDQTLQGMWTVKTASTGSVPAGMFPAKYTFAPIGTPSCASDYVVFTINTAGVSGEQANLLGVNNLYVGTCTTGAVPTIKFAYFIGTGIVQTSSVLSVDGTKIAFVESITGNGTSTGSNFHVLTIGTTGSNGTMFNSPVAPCTVNTTKSCTTNNAVDIKIPMSGFVSVTRSSPFVDYLHDVAYVGDDNGVLHKFTPVFNGTPAEVTTGGWPFTVVTPGVILSGPTYDQVSQHIFIGGSAGRLFCISVTGASPAACSPSYITVGTGSVLDAPLVDSTTHMVFATTSNASNAILTQATTSLGSQTNVTMGVAGNNLYNGAFDHLYFTSVGTGHMYFCGNSAATPAQPTLYRVGFSSTGVINGTLDSSGSFLLTANQQAANCSPLTEVYNTAQSTDYLFLDLNANGFNASPGPTCGGPCLVSFVLPTSTPLTFPTPHATATAALVGATGPSGIIIDNVSSATGASQIYFGAPQLGEGLQVSQSALK
jgi:hypothetical protein